MLLWMQVVFVLLTHNWGTELFRLSIVNIMVADALAPCVARLSEAMIHFNYIVQDFQYHRADSRHYKVTPSLIGWAQT